MPKKFPKTNSKNKNLGFKCRNTKLETSLFRAFELALRTYEGDDPLEPWYNYIIWVEQTFTKAGKDGNLNTLLEKCIKEFKGDEKYEQDQRFFDVWLKYANLSPHALEVYTYMYSEAVCDKLARFYVEWAWQLEQVNSYKKAEQTFNLALQKIEQHEKEFLEMKHKQFQARVMKKMLEKSNDDVETETEEQRTALSALKSQGKKNKVGSVRIGAAKLAEGPGVLVSSGQVPSRPSSNSTKFQVYEENDENQPDMIQSKTASSNLPFTKERNR